jgi:serine/threonine-protein kinase
LSSSRVGAAPPVAEDPAFAARGLQIVGVLGEGGSAIVYRARDERHDRDVAVKVLRDDTALGRAAERFAREVRLAARLRHAHILPLFDSGRLADGRVFAVMPVSSGRPLRAIIAEGPLALTDALRIAREVAEALVYLHAQGYVHRDIKPENILVESGHAVLTDFGLAAAMEDSERAASPSAEWWINNASQSRLTEGDGVAGTLAYMAPETLMGDAKLHGKADVYALACVLFEMLGGELEVAGASPASVLARRLAGPLPSLARLQQGGFRNLGAMMARCTAVDPDSRPAAAELFAQLQSVNPADGEDSLSGIRAGRRWASIGAFALIVGVGVAAWLLHRARQESALDPHRVVVADLINDTGDSLLSKVGVLAGDIITAQLSDSTSLDVVNADVALPSRMVRHLPVNDSLLSLQTRQLLTATRAGLVVTGAYFRTGALLEIVAEATDAQSGRVLGVAGPVRGAPAYPDTALRALGSQIAQIIKLRHQPPR